MDEGTSSGSQAAGIIQENHGDRGIHRNYPEKRVHFNAAHCNYKSCIDIASDACIYIKELLRTWRENDWHDKGNFLRLNKNKCEDLLSYLEQAKGSYHPNTCDFAATEFLTVVKRAKFLVEESSHNKWLLKAVELWECSQHFVEICLDLCWSSQIMSLGVKNSKEQEWLENSRRPNVQAKLLKTQRYDDKKTLDAMVKTILDRTLKEGGEEHQLALLLDDRLNDQSSWHPPILTKFNFCIRSRISIYSRGSSKIGASGIVLRFPWVYKKQFAVKMRHPNTSNVENMFRNEFDVLDKYRSPYIVGVVGYWELQSRLDMRPWTTLCPFLLMEAMERDLEGLICSYRESRKGTEMQEGFSALETIKLMLPIAKALRFLHDEDVAHRDVKLQNIMCSNAMGDFDDAIVKLIDFGEATVGVSKISCDTHRPVGTKGYMDPEMWKMEGYDLLRADVFSFAMVFVELLTWRSPWGKIGRDVQDKLNNGERPPLPKDLPDYISFIVECCWCPDPTLRPSFIDICRMLPNAKLLLQDENFFTRQGCDMENLFSYEDETCVERNLHDREFLQA